MPPVFNDKQHSDKFFKSSDFNISDLIKNNQGCWKKQRVFDSPFLNKAALVLIWLLLMGGTFFYANKNYFLYHENPNLIKADGYYLYNFGSPRHYYWALPVKFTHEDKVYHSQLPLDIRDESSSCTVDLRIYIPADSSGSAFAFRNNITIPALWRIFIFVPLLLLLTSKRKA